MMLTDLADVLRRADLPVIERTGWKLRGHGGGRCACSPCSSRAPFTSVASITLHHTAGRPDGDMPSLEVVETGRTSLPGPLAQLALSRSGVWFTVAAGLSYHAGVVAQAWQGNGYAIGIEAEATGTALWPDVQYRSYVRGVKALMDRYGVPLERVLGHKEVAVFPAGHAQAGRTGRKSDPNFSMPAFRAALNTTTPGVSVSLEGDVALLASQLVKGPDPAAWGWPTFPGGSGERLTVVDYLRRQNERTETLTAKVNALGASIAAIVPGAVVELDAQPVIDLDALAEKVADLLAARLAA